MTITEEKLAELEALFAALAPGPQGRHEDEVAALTAKVTALESDLAARTAECKTLRNGFAGVDAHMRGYRDEAERLASQLAAVTEQRNSWQRTAESLAGFDEKLILARRDLAAVTADRDRLRTDLAHEYSLALHMRPVVEAALARRRAFQARHEGEIDEDAYSEAREAFGAALDAYERAQKGDGK